MIIILETLIGSRLHGTHRADSDFDRFIVNLPSARDILLGQAGKGQSTHNPNHADGDVQVHPVAVYLDMLCGGQGPAMDAFFAPPSLHLRPEHAMFGLIREAAPQLITSGLPGMLAFCRNQVLRSIDMGERLNAVRAVQTLASAHSGRVASMLEEFSELVKVYPNHLGTEEKLQGPGQPMLHLKVCGRYYPITLLSKDFVRGMDNIIAQYGKRAYDAAQGKKLTGRMAGVDLRALSHAVRIAREIEEFLNTGHIIFPRPEAQYLMDVRNGLINAEAAIENVTAILERVDVLDISAKKNVQLRDDLITEIYGRVVRGQI